MRTLTRRTVLKLLAAGVPAAYLGRSRAYAAAVPSPRPIATGKFEPTWESLRQYRAPDWFRDAKFGIWSHWSAQCVPEQGDWYARKMYQQDDFRHQYHTKHYGHPSKFGFMEINNLWKTEKWNPEELMDLYVKAGAKYFVSLANHHDNFDNYDSAHHGWNSVRVGPKRDIVGTWAKLARRHGLRFGVSNHSAHAWHWFQTAYGYDAEGPFAGVRYDAHRLRKEDGKDTWWEGLDPQELYTGPNMVIPDGINTIAAAKEWHLKHDRVWTEEPPANNPAFVEKWFLRCQDLLDKYHPDLLYFDNTELPLGQAGLDIAAHFYNANVLHHGGDLQAVLNTKELRPEHTGTMVLDIERGRADRILSAPWQTDTCLGSWHYSRSVFEKHEYKSAPTVVRMLIDIVSKNGCLLLSVPQRGDGTIDEDERKILTEIAGWMSIHSEAIHGTRPFSIFGEGPPDVTGSSNFNERNVRAYTAEDVRFTTKGGILYAFVLAWPGDGRAVIKTLAQGSGHHPGKIGRVELLGHDGSLPFTRTTDGLAVTLPSRRPSDICAALKLIPA